MNSLLGILRLSLSISQPLSVFPLVEAVFSHSMRAWEAMQREGDSTEEEEEEEEGERDI